jgi:hypothetical protein
MNALEMPAFRCGKCLAGPYRSREQANDCCTCTECGIEKDARSSFCKPCWQKRDAAREAKAFAAATKIPLAEYGHSHVYAEGHGDEGYLDVDSIDDEWADGVGRPEYVWGCSDQDTPTFDLRDEIANRLSDEYHERVVESVLDGGDEVERAQALITQAMQRGHGFMEDQSVAVLLSGIDEVAP